MKNESRYFADPASPDQLPSVHHFDGATDLTEQDYQDFDRLFVDADSAQEHDTIANQIVLLNSSEASAFSANIVQPAKKWKAGLMKKPSDEKSFLLSMLRRDPRTQTEKLSLINQFERQRKLMIGATSADVQDAEGLSGIYSAAELVIRYPEDISNLKITEAEWQRMKVLVKTQKNANQKLGHAVALAILSKKIEKAELSY